jgi:hypothetical protein
MIVPRSLIAAFGMIWLADPSPARAQARAGTSATPVARASAPIDLTGYWVSFVTEDWRFRMVTPPKGDYRGVPLNDEGRKMADRWDPTSDEAAGHQCKAYGAAAIMRVPTRLHVTWETDDTLRVDTDAGTQTRVFHFGASRRSPGPPSWQGHSMAQWERPPHARGAGPAARPAAGGSLKVVTTNMRSGYLRRNGVPYSEGATLTEYFDVAPLPGGGLVLLVTAVVEDPRYLLQPFIVSSQFKKEADNSKWDPTPCSARW